MDYKSILEKLLANAIQSFNSGNFGSLNNFFADNLSFTGPEYDNSIIKEAAVELTKPQDIFNYWIRLHGNYPFRITAFEFLEIGKVSRFRSVMQDLGYVVDAEIHFDEYGKVNKLLNEIVEALG